MEIKGKVVLITGAGKGCGRTLAETFAEQGARVALNDISPINVDEVTDKINSRGETARSYIEDVAKKVGAQALVKGVLEDLGGMDILINHAAVEPHSPLLDMDEWDWHRTLDVNLTGAFLMMQSAGRVMRAQGHGTIINIVAGTDAKRETGAYISSKAGLTALSHQAEIEFRPHGIRVYAVENSENIIKDIFALLEAA